MFGRSFFLLRESRALQIIAQAVFVAILVVGLIFVILRQPDELLAAASLNFSTIDYSKVTCVSIAPDGVTVEGKDTPDPKLAKSIADILSIKTVLFDAAYSECPWDFSVNVAPGPLAGIHYGLLPAQYLVSVRARGRRPCEPKKVSVQECLRIQLACQAPRPVQDRDYRVEAGYTGH